MQPPLLGSSECLRKRGVVTEIVIVIAVEVHAPASASQRTAASADEAKLEDDEIVHVEIAVVVADAGDDIVDDEDFASTSVTISHDHAGNMIDDGTFRYVYDAWNRLVTVKSSTDSGAVTFQTAEFDARGRRIKKVVDNSGDFDGTVVYLFDGHKIIETRDGSDNVVQQFIHGTRYIGNGLWPDELVMMRAIDKGDLYIHQDANWNVIALTDLGGSVVERYVYTPYGELTVHQETSYGDRDGDQDVDATDKGTPGTTCTGTVTGACRILDLDFDGDYDATDADEFEYLAQGLSRHPARTSTGVHQPFGHQGLLYEPEIGQYQNRARQYDPGKRRFAQRDPLQSHPDILRLGIPSNLLGVYRDGTNVYSYELCNPPTNWDWSGFCCGSRPCTGAPPRGPMPAAPCTWTARNTVGGCSAGSGTCACDRGCGCNPEAAGGLGLQTCVPCWWCHCTLGWCAWETTSNGRTTPCA